MLLFSVNRKKFDGSFTFVTEKRNNGTRRTKRTTTTNPTNPGIDLSGSFGCLAIRSYHKISSVKFCKGHTFKDTYYSGKQTLERCEIRLNIATKTLCDRIRS